MVERQSACLTLPVIMPQEADNPAAELQGRRAREVRVAAAAAG